MLRQLASLLNPSEAQAFRTLTKVGGDQVNFIDKNVYMILWYLSLKREWDTLTENFMIGLIGGTGWNWSGFWKLFWSLKFFARQAPLVRHSVFEVGHRFSSIRSEVKRAERAGRSPDGGRAGRPVTSSPPRSKEQVRNHMKSRLRLPRIMFDMFDYPGDITRAISNAL